MFDFLKKKKEEPIKVIDDKLIAVTSLLVEAAIIDEDFGKKEKEIIVSIIKKQFSLEKNYNINELIDNTVSNLNNSGDLVTYTRTIKENWDLKDRIEVIQMMWKVCLIDEKIEPYEDMLIRRVSGLIYVSDKDRNEAKKKALMSLENKKGES